MFYNIAHKAVYFFRKLIEIKKTKQTHDYSEGWNLLGQVAQRLRICELHLFAWQLNKSINIYWKLNICPGSPHSSVGKESACSEGEPGLIPGLGGKICWRRNRLPTPVFLGFPCGSAGKESSCNEGDLGWEDPLEKGKATHSSIRLGEFHGLYSTWGCKELDMTEWLSHTFSLLYA